MNIAKSMKPNEKFKKAYECSILTVHKKLFSLYFQSSNSSGTAMTPRDDPERDELLTPSATSTIQTIRYSPHK
jgi:hypothetical protein